MGAARVRFLVAAFAAGTLAVSPVGAPGPHIEAATPSIPDEIPVSGIYEVVESGVQVDVTFGADGSLRGVATGGRPCPTDGTAVFEGAWAGTAYEGRSFQFVPADDGSCTVALSDLPSTFEIVSPAELRWCTAATEIDPEAGACGTLRRLPTTYVVELVTWIAHETIVDPALTGPAAGLAPELLDLAPEPLRPCLGAESVQSVIGGQGHRDIGGPVLATVRATFTASAEGAVSGFDSEVEALTITRTTLGLFEAGEPTQCTQAVTLSGEDVGNVVLAGNTVSLKFDTDLAVVPVSAAELASGDADVLRRFGCGDGDLPCDVGSVVRGVPRIRASVDVVVKPDGTLTFTAQTSSFPSFGLRIFAAAEPIAAVVLYDSVCHRLDGEGGRTNLVELIGRTHRVTARSAADLLTHACVPFALPGDTSSPDEDFRQYPEKLPAFVLAVRYADARG